MNRTQLKARARVSMLWARPGVLMVCMSYWLIRLVIDWFTALEIPLENGVPRFSALWANAQAVALLAATAAVAVAVQILATGHDYLYPLRLSRDTPASVKTFFEPARRPWRFIALPLLVKLLCLLPLLPALGLTLLNIHMNWHSLSAMLAALSAALATAQSTLTLQPMVADILNLAVPVTIRLAAALGGVLALFISLTYAQAVFVAIDEPKLGLLGCLSRSRSLMQGRRVERFKITLSFIPWYIPMAVCMGLVLSSSLWAMLALGSALLLTIWAVTYRNVTYANYYSLITGQLKRQQAPGMLSARDLMRLATQPPPEDAEAEGDTPADAPDAPADAPPPEGETEEQKRRRLIDEMWKR